MVTVVLWDGGLSNLAQIGPSYLGGLSCDERAQ
jgi:hypothetical protein